MKNKELLKFLRFEGIARLFLWFCGSITQRVQRLQGATMSEEPKALQLVKYITDNAVKGIGPLSGAEELAKEYLDDSKYRNNTQRVRDLIKNESRKSFTIGFLTNLGGLLTLPIAIPADMAASWIVEARLASTIASIYGHKLQEDTVKTFVLLVIVGGRVKDILKESGVKVVGRLAKNLLDKVPGEMLIKINQKIGMRLLTKAGQKGVVNLTKGLPLISAFIGGFLNRAFAKAVGKRAIRVFRIRKSRKRPERHT